MSSELKPSMPTRDELLGEQRNPENEFWHRLWDLRDIGEHPCPRCTGTGRKSYPNTATYFGGIGGQAITSAECNLCWGTGDAERPGANLKELHLKVREARRAPSPAVKALVEAAREWREADDQLRGPMGSAAPQTALNRLASRTGKLREALATVEREIQQ